MTARSRTEDRTSKLRPRLLTGALALALVAGCGPSAPPPEEPKVAEPPATAAAKAAEPEGSMFASGEQPPLRQAEEAAGSAPEPPADPAGQAYAAGPGVPEQAVMTGPYTRGRALAYMPRDCEERVYVDVAGLAGPDRAGLAKLVDQAIAMATPMLGGGSQITAALATLRSAGVDPAYALHEIAACDSPDTAVLGFEGTKPIDPLVTGQRLLTAIGEAPGVIERRGGYRVLAERPGGGDAVVDVAPGVLVLVDDWSAGEQALGARGGQAGFRDAGRSLVWAQTDEGSLVVDGKGDVLDIVLRVRAGSDPKTAAQRAQREAAEIKQEMGKLATRLASSPLKALAPRLRAARVQAEGAHIVGRGSIARSEIADLIRVAGSMGMGEIEALVEGREPPPPPPRR